MGASRTRHLVTHRLRAGVAVTALGLALASAAAGPATAPSLAPAPAPRGPAVKGAPGVVVQFQESAGTNLLYQQEKGGMVSSVPPPVPDPRQERDKADEPARPSPAPAATIARKP